ncbi:MAG: DUF6090 family protein [Saprospiraceae bacterium]
MIKFFRQIRKNLTEQSKTCKYLKYAIGEIILVVIGILIALSMNNWNTKRQNKIEETNILFQLEEEYKGKLDELNQKVTIRNLMIEGTHKILENINQENYNLPIDSLNIYIGQSILTPTYNASNAVTEELLNSGKLYLISNKKLRKLITEWSGQLEKLIEEEQYLVNTYISNIDPYMNKIYPMNNTVSPIFHPSKETSNNFSKTQTSKDYKPKHSNKTVDIKALFNDLEFENYMGQINEYSVAGNMQSEDIRMIIESVLTLINSELKGKQ